MRENRRVRVESTDLAGVVVFRPEPFRDDRGLFTRTFEARVFDDHAVSSGVRASEFLQDSQSRSRFGVVRGMHGRAGRGESKLVRCARGAVHDVLVDIRPGSPTFGRHQSFLLDDVGFAHLFVPRGFLHGFQALTDIADVCYRIDREHNPAEDIAVRYDDPALGIAWPRPVTVVSARDAAAGTWPELRASL